MTEQIKILIADDHPILCESLGSLLQQELDMDVVGYAGDGRTAITMTQELQPDVVVMDISMPDLNGIDATRKIMQLVQPPHVICLSIHREHSMVTSMLKAGASGYVLKNSAAHELVNAIHAVCEGNKYLCAGVTTDLINIECGTDPKKQSTAFEELTARERQVLQLLAEGNHTNAIAASLNISPKTIYAHKKTMMAKIGAKTIADIMRYAIQQNLTEL